MKEKEITHPDSIEDLANVVPKMQVEVSKEHDCIVKDEQLLNLYDEVLVNIRQDREEVNEHLSQFVDLVMNGGDGSSASKEAIVNLIKIKSDTADKMVKIADLMTRLKLKDNNTMPRWMAAQQNNKITIESNTKKRDLLKAIHKAKEGKNDKS